MTILQSSLSSARPRGFIPTIFQLKRCVKTTRAMSFRLWAAVHSFHPGRTKRATTSSRVDSTKVLFLSISRRSALLQEATKTSSGHSLKKDFSFASKLLCAVTMRSTMLSRIRALFTGSTVLLQDSKKARLSRNISTTDIQLYLWAISVFMKLQSL